ncbi:MAG: hypothetical protein V8Q85_05820 [Christensenellales bacterium]
MSQDDMLYPKYLATASLPRRARLASSCVITRRWAIVTRPFIIA